MISTQNSSFSLKFAYSLLNPLSKYRIMAKKRLKDYLMLAFACKCTGKHRDEGELTIVKDFYETT